ncbi:MAG: DUF721 domain-containing protein [Burkholderiaceae bacterium]|nr:DUF721 domain-containing protein [Burkholderiaceae bacterium]
MAKSLPNFTPARRPSQKPAAKEAVEFLQGSDRLAGLLPEARRVGQLQAACERLLPTLFANCRALQIRDGQLQVAVPNAALATRLRQVLPKLQQGLREQGWPVEGIRLKVQLLPSEPERPTRRVDARDLPVTAVDSFAQLAESLGQDPRNAALQQALAALVRRRGR